MEREKSKVGFGLTAAAVVVAVVVVFWVGVGG